MTSYDQIEAVFKKCGWVCKGEVSRYRRTGRVVPIDTVMRAMPDDILEDVVAAWGEHKLGQEIRAAKAQAEHRERVE
jgi:hypothetical protein